MAEAAPAVELGQIDWPMIVKALITHVRQGAPPGHKGLGVGGGRPSLDEIESAASAIINARGMRRGVPSIGNVLAILPADLKAEVMEEAEAALKAAEVAHVRQGGGMDTETALKRAQAYNECLTRHVYSLIETTKAKGAPDAATLIFACEVMLRKSWEAGERAASSPRASAP
jgi:hypothetical protein